MDEDIGWKYILKYCIIGDSGVGKSCILVRFTDNNFYNTTTATLGVEVSLMSIYRWFMYMLSYA